MNKSKEETIRFRLDKSDEVMREAKALVAIKSWSGTVSRLYYSTFHVVSALMLDRDIRIKAHAGAKAMFDLYFVKTSMVEVKWSKLYSRLSDARHSSDYGAFIEFTADDVLPLVP
ncbi:HEPN domain-containing protein [Fibrella forsythiae]|uniref:HEPN domain-containing protein n=1 Tax=Fibrella forsythiae TaxID=2817061 RepID=A0ABS3JRZ1_9BACT|nr:HEPN domain-containing protein [Fibrella forsythiae]MBO0952141.1 HEPN domain-containing protein [Fibrella forsythiae]